MRQDNRYAEVTGDGFHFVRTLSNLGSRLLRLYRLDADAVAGFGLWVERALAWEPTDPFCWALWADWFAYQGRSDAQEWILREATRLFPDNAPSRVELARLLIRRGADHWDEAERWLREAAGRNPNQEPSRVELARLLIRRGADHWDEAERWLREVAGRNPNDAPSRVFMAWLLVRRHQTSEATKLLSDFIKQNPKAQRVRQLLDQLSAKMAFDLPAEELDEDGYGEGESHPTVAADCEFSEALPESAAEPSGDSTALNEIAHRGRLGIEFGHGLSANARGQIPATPLIEEAAGQGDVLAGFYSQWLMPDKAPGPPPHAWAWNACRFWQRSASPEEWRRLEGQFAEMAAETAFLQLLQTPGGGDWESSAARWRARYANEEDAPPRPVVAFLENGLERLPRIGPDERSQIALAVMAGSAEPAPEFAS